MGFSRDIVSDDTAYIEQQWLAARALLHRWQSRASAAFLLRYEDLLSEPEQTLSALLQSLALDYGPSVVSAMRADAARETPERVYHRTTQSPRASINRWRHDLSEKVQAACAEAFGPILQAFGYDL